MTSENKDRTRETYYRKLFGEPKVEPNASVEGIVDLASEGIKVSLDDYLIMRDVRLVGSNGNVFESHPVVYVAKDVVRDEDGNFKRENVYNAIKHLENEIEVPAGYFSALPTMALNCAILIYSFGHGVEKYEDGIYIIKDEDWRSVLDQFGDSGGGYGWQACATIVNGAGNRIIDNPRDANFPNIPKYGKGNINRSRQQRVHEFIRDDLESKPLSAIDKSSNLYDFFQDLTGQSDLKIFDEIAKYFSWKFSRDLISKIFVPDNSYCSLWVGSDDSYFDVDANDKLDASNAFRGVLLEEEVGLLK